MPAFSFPNVTTIEIGVTDDGGTSFRTQRLTVTRDGHGRVSYSDGVKTVETYDNDVNQLLDVIAGLTA